MSSRSFSIALSGLHFYAFHGVLPQENTVGNEFVVDISVSFPAVGKIGDDLSKSISYADLFDMIRTEMNLPSLLLEDVCERIAGAVLNRFPIISSGFVRITKLSPPIAACNGSASVALNF